MQEFGPDEKSNLAPGYDPIFAEMQPEDDMSDKVTDAEAMEESLVVRGLSGDGEAHQEQLATLADEATLPEESAKVLGMHVLEWLTMEGLEEVAGVAQESLAHR